MLKRSKIHYYILAQHIPILIYTYVYAKMLYNALLHFSTTYSYSHLHLPLCQNVV